MPLPFSSPVTFESIERDLVDITDQTLTIDDVASVLEFFKQVEPSVMGEQRAVLRLIENKIILSDRHKFITAICSMDHLSLEMRAEFFRLLPGITEVTEEMIPVDIRDHLVSLDIPGGVICIEEGAFSQCTSLQSITFPDGLREIEAYAFAKCSRLSRVELPNGLRKIEMSAFANCSLISIDLPDGLREIEEYAFAKCGNLETISLPNNLEKIGEGAFMKCHNLSSIDLPDRLQTIKIDAFKGCTALQEIVVPLYFMGKDIDYWRSIGKPDHTAVVCHDALYNAVKDESFNMHALTMLFNTKADHSLSSADARIYLKSFLATRSISHLPDFAECLLTKVRADDKQAFINNVCGVREFPVEMRAAFFRLVDGITHVSKEMMPAGFRNNLVSLDIPEGVTSIQRDAFEYCDNLSAIAFPDALQEIGSGAFEGCSKLKYINLPDKLQRLDICAFDKCTSLKRVDLPDKLVEIGRSAFAHCALDRIILPSSLQLIDQFVFYKCENLKRIQWPKNLKEIGDYAFSGCTALQSIELPDGLKEIGDYAFYGCISLNHIELPNCLELIDESAFEGCKSLQLVELPDGLNRIGLNAFKGCTALKEIVAPLSFMGEDADYWRSVGKPDHIPVVCRDALYNAVKDESFSMDALMALCNTKEDGYLSFAHAQIYLKAFKNERGLAQLLDFAEILLEKTNDDEKQTFMHGMCVMEDIPTEMSAAFFRLSPDITEVTEEMIPIEIKRNIESLKLPEGVISIEDDTFSDCRSLSSIDLPFGLQTIGEFAFGRCFALSSMNLPDGLQVIDEEAFKYCRSLKRIELPVRLQQIGRRAFTGCTALEEIAVPLSFMGKDADYWRSVGKPDHTSVVCRDGLYNAIAEQQDINGIFLEISLKGLDDSSTNAITIYLNVASRLYAVEDVIKLSQFFLDYRNKQGLDNDEMLADHLRYLYSHNRFGLLKAYEQFLGLETLQKFLVNVMQDNTERVSKCLQLCPENVTYKYLCINPRIDMDEASCNVNVLLPFSAGQLKVATDNTCKATVEMQHALDGGMQQEIQNLIAAIDTLLGEMDGIVDSKNKRTFSASLLRIKSECEAYLEEYADASTSLCHIKSQLLQSLQSVFIFPEVITSLLAQGSNSNLYSAVFSPVDVSEGGTYPVDPYVRTTKALATCWFSRKKYIDDNGDILNDGQFSPFAALVADSMKDQAVIKALGMREKVRGLTETKMATQRIAQDELVARLRVLIEEKEVDLLDQRNILEGLNTDLVCMQNNPEFMDVMRCIQKFYNEGFATQQAKIRAFQRGEKAIIDDLVTLISERLDNVRYAIGQSEKELDAYISCRDAKGMIIRLPKADDLLMQSAQEQLRRKKALIEAYTHLLPKEAQNISWEDVFKHKDVDLDDVASMLHVLHDNWEFVDLDHGGSNPFYDVLEYGPNQESVGLKNANQLALFSQFAIARMNVFVRSKGLSDADFGEILDHDDHQDLRVAFCTTLVEVMHAKGDVEEAIMDFVNKNHVAFGITSALSSEEMQYCAEQIKRQITLLKDSPHMDEFFFLEDVEDPLFVAYRNLLSFPFAKLATLPGEEPSLRHRRQLEAFSALKKDGATVDVDEVLTLDKMLEVYPDIKDHLMQKCLQKNMVSADFMDSLQRQICGESLMPVKSKTYGDMVKLIKILDIEHYTRFMDLCLDRCLDDTSKRLLMTALDCPNSVAYVKTHPDLIGLLATAHTSSPKLAGISVTPVSIDGGAAEEEKQSADKKPKVSKKPK